MERNPEAVEMTPKKRKITGSLLRKKRLSRKARDLKVLQRIRKSFLAKFKYSS